MKRIAIAALLGLAVTGCSREEIPPADSGPVVRKTRLIKDVANTRQSCSARVEAQRKARAERSRTQNDGVDGMRDVLSSRDYRTYSRLSEALDDDNLDEIKKLVGGMNGTEAPEVKEKAIEALGWFGEDMEALEAIRNFTRDEEASVAESAYSKIGENLGLLKPAQAGRFLKTMLLTCPKAGAAEFVFEQVRTAEVSRELMDAVLTGIRSTDKETVALAKETYLEMTGDDFRGSDEAYKWVSENRIENNEEAE